MIPTAQKRRGAPLILALVLAIERYHHTRGSGKFQNSIEKEGIELRIYPYLR
jgi:hypothetical protein